MAKKHWLDTIRYTSVGLFRMTRDGIGAFFDKAYETGKGKQETCASKVPKQTFVPTPPDDAE